MSHLEETAEELKSSMSNLKTQLYAKFGNHINLEGEEEWNRIINKNYKFYVKMNILICFLLNENFSLERSLRILASVKVWPAAESRCWVFKGCRSFRKKNLSARESLRDRSPFPVTLAVLNHGKEKVIFKSESRRNGKEKMIRKKPSGRKPKTYYRRMWRKKMKSGF